MLKSIKLDGVGPVRKLSASFGERLNVLTGDNGLGKSFVLDIAFWALTSCWPAHRVAIPDERPHSVRPLILFSVAGDKQRTKVVRKATYDFRTQSWTPRPNKPIRPGLVIYGAVDGGFLVWDPSRNHGRAGNGASVNYSSEASEKTRCLRFSPAVDHFGLRHPRPAQDGGADGPGSSRTFARYACCWWVGVSG
jgi:hypothetical protein